MTEEKEICLCCNRCGNIQPALKAYTHCIICGHIFSGEDQIVYYGEDERFFVGFTKDINDKKSLPVVNHFSTWSDAEESMPNKKIYLASYNEVVTYFLS